MHLHRLERVGAAGGVEPAPRAEQRADETPVPGQQQQQNPGGGRRPLARVLLCRTSHGCVSSRTLRPTLPPKQCCDYQVEFGGEIRLACGRGPGIGTHHQQATFRKRPQIPAGQMTQPAAGPCCAPQPRPPPGSPRSPPALARRDPAAGAGGRRPVPARAAAAADRPRELRALPHPCRCGKHRPITAGRASQAPVGSDTDPRTPLTAPGRQDRAAGAGAHAQPEPVRLRTAAVVRLERTLAHWDSRYTEARVEAATGPARRHAKASPRGGRTNERYAGGAAAWSNRAPATAVAAATGRLVAPMPRGRRLPVTECNTCRLPNARRTLAP